LSKESECRFCEFFPFVPEEVIAREEVLRRRCKKLKEIVNEYSSSCGFFGEKE